MPRPAHIPHLHKSLYPLAWLYSGGVWLRNKLFDMGILPVEEFSIPIISVGNLTVGGTGKTPLIEYLIELLSPQLHVAVLSRGYNRKSKGWKIADENASAQSLGDEPYQIHCKYPHVIVAVDSNRRRGIRNLLTLSHAPDVILLDDAHQHRYVRPSFSIVLCDYNRPIYSDLPLPVGRLREPRSGLSRADVVILTKCNHILTQQEMQHEAAMLQYDAQRMYASHIEYGSLQTISDNTTHNIADIIHPDTHVILLTGIANPQPMQQYIEEYSHNIMTYNYPDHHYYTQQEINQVADDAHRHQSVIITTQKDAARLRAMNLTPDFRNNCYVLPLRIALQPPHDTIAFDQLIGNHVNSRL